MSLSRSVRALVRLIPLGLALSVVPPALQAGEPPGDLTADLVLGQADFVFGQYNRGGSPAASTLGQPQEVAIDRSVFPNRVYVADTSNNRVLAWSSTLALTNGLAAELVFGQNGSFVTNAAVYAPTTAATLITPGGVAVDAVGNLYVSSQQENRVLRYNAPFSTNTSNGKGDAIADAAFGQADFVSRGGNPDPTTSTSNPYGIAVDSSDNLYVASLTDGRVVRFANASTASTGAAISAVFGQPTLTSLGQNTGGISASSLNYPWSASISEDGDLYVSDWLNNRVLRYANAATATTGAAAVGVFGQPNFTTSSAAATASKLNGPRDAAVDAAGKLWIADTGNHRVLRYDAAGLVTTPGPSATAVLGQGGNFTTNTTTTTAAGLSAPVGIAFDALGNVYIADSSNNRVVRFDGGSPGIPAAPTDLVATPGNTTASISFTAPDGAISNYQYSTNDGASYTAFSPADDTSPVTITGLSNGVAYTIRLRAVGTYGAGAPSDSVSVTPLLPAIAGTCGTAHDVAMASSPAAQLCATGTAGAVTSTGGQWAWACNGTGGSVVNASCGAPFQTQTISLAANPTSIPVNGSSTVTASSTSGLAPSLSLAGGTDCTLGESSGTVTVTASITAVNAAGSCVVQADRAASNDGCTACYQSATQETVSVTLTKADQTISFGTAPTGLVVGGATGTVSATATSGLAVTFSNGMSMYCGISGSTVTPLRAGTCTVLANQAGNANYNLAPQASQDITIGKGGQSITGFAANPASLVVDGGSATLSASGGDSGLAVIYASSTPSICTVAGTTVTAVAAGTCTVTANQAGNVDYNAATTVTLNLTIGKASQTISGFASNPASLVVGGGNATLSATGGASGNAISYSSSTTGICTVSGSTVTPVAAGTCTVVANQAGNGDYNAATSASLNISVGLGSQAISGFASNPASLSVGGGTATLSATGGASGNAISYSSSTTGTCTVSGSTVTPVAAGTCTVVANQAGNANYNAATASNLNITVGRGSQAISGFASNPASLSVGGGTATLSATGGASGNAVTYSSSTTSICTVSGSTVTPVAAGACTVVANQAGNGNYNAATASNLNITVGRGSQAISVFASNPASLSVGGGSATLSATGGASGNAVTYSSSTTSVCTVSGSTVTPVAAGTCTVVANQAGNGNYNAATAANLSITVGRGNQAISVFASNPASLSVGGGSTTLSATGGASGNAVTYSSGTTAICTISGSTVSPVAAGTCLVFANQAGNGNYNAAPPITLGITVDAGSQAITSFTSNPTSLVVGGGNALLSATGGASGNALSYSSSTTGICTVSGNAVMALSEGTCTVIANQAGNANYAAAPAVALNLTVTRGSQSIGGLAASPSALVVGGGNATLSATGGASGNALSYSSSTLGVCTVSGSTVTPVAAGTCTVIANQAGNGGYNAAPAASLNIAVAQGSQSIRGFTSSTSSLLVNRGTASLTASGGASGNAVSFASLTPEICTVDGSTVTAIAAGSCTVSASQAGNGNYLAAAVQTLAISVSTDSIEDTVPSTGGSGSLGDGNGDDIADSTQDDVASLPTLTGDSFATIASSSGRTLSLVTTVAVPDDFPTDVRVPLSGVAFTLNQTGASETVDLYFPASDRVIGLRKRNRSTGVYDSLPVTVTRVGNRTRITFTLTDGGDYDADGLVNGSISDPVFPEVAAAAASGGGSAGWLTLLPMSLLALIRRRRLGHKR